MASVKLLLKESIKHVGKVGDIVEVSPGYARNYLLPKDLAVEPTPNMTCTLYGLIDYDVQFWDGSNWVTVPGGSIRSNDKVITEKLESVWPDVAERLAAMLRRRGVNRHDTDEAIQEGLGCG